MSTTEPTPLFVRGADHNPQPGDPYAGDKLSRKELGERIAALIDRLHEGAVISIDAPWGEGKTWFAKSLKASLDAKFFSTCYIDCFQRDYVDDPFAVIAGALVDLAGRKDLSIQQGILETGKKIGAALLPIAGKVIFNVVSQHALGQVNIPAEYQKQIHEIENKGADQLEKLIGSRLTGFHEEQKTIVAFKAKLAELSLGEKHPIVLFIDELDRCKPDFAISMLERIKHFFDVPNIIFVLLVNRASLEAAIRGRYGEKFDAKTYLEKFIQLPLILPKQRAESNYRSSFNYLHLRDRLDALKLTNEGSQSFAFMMAHYADFLDLSLRSMERAAILFAMAQPIGNSAEFIAWPIALKLRHPDLFARIRRGDQEAHGEASSLIKQISAEDPFVREINASFCHIHDKINNPNYHIPDKARVMPMGARFPTVDSFVKFLCNRIDLPISPN